MKTLTILTGAGMSAESGVKTFRDAGGLWEGHDIMQVASPQGWAQNPQLVLDFYNQRRAQLKEVYPNTAHYGLKRLEEKFRVQIITQNVDNLHERAGSTNVLHLHGELLKVRSTCDENDIVMWAGDLHLGDVCKKGCQLRPHIVWFGEAVPMMDKAIEMVQQSDVFVIIGTSMQVYPAASLIHFLSENAPVYYIDPRPNLGATSRPHLTIMPKTATEGVTELLALL